MTKEQRGPLVAFVVLAVLTCGLLTHALRSEAAERLFVASAQSVIGGSALSPLPQQMAGIADPFEPRPPAVITDQVVTHMVALGALGESQHSRSVGLVGSLVHDPLSIVTQSLNNQPGLAGDVLTGAATLLTQTVDGVTTVTHNASAGASVTNLFGSNFQNATALASEAPDDAAPTAPNDAASPTAQPSPSQAASAPHRGQGAKAKGPGQPRGPLTTTTTLAASTQTKATRGHRGADKRGGPRDGTRQDNARDRGPHRSTPKAQHKQSNGRGPITDSRSKDKGGRDHGRGQKANAPHTAKPVTKPGTKGTGKKASTKSEKRSAKSSFRGSRR